MSEECQMPEPGPEHKFVMEAVGTWDVACKFFMQPGTPPMETKAVDTITAIGGFWNTGRFESTFMGAPFVGISSLGYNPMKGKYVSTWIDATSPHLFVFEGNLDASKKFLKMVGKGPDMQGNLVDWRLEMEYKGKDSNVMRMWMSTPGGEFQLMENTYTRRA